MRRSRGTYAASILAIGLLLAGCAAASPDPPPTASVDQPQRLTSEQADALAAMRYRNFVAGVVGFDAEIVGQRGDLALIGWVDFGQRTGYARAIPSDGSAFLLVWDSSQVAFLDGAEPSESIPPAVPPTSGWQTAPLDPTASELTRVITALILLAEDRPDNPQLLRQSGARYLGEEEISGVVLQRFSGAAADPSAGDVIDLGTQYWLDTEGLLARFGIRLGGDVLSIVDLDREATPAASLPLVSGLEAGP